MIFGEYDVKAEAGIGGYHFRHIYLYGAGKYGKKYLRLLQAEGICVTAFITTEYEISTYCGLPVYGVNDISPLITEKDWVILAYKGADSTEVGQRFCHIKPHIIHYDSPKIRHFMKYETFFAPIVRRLQKQFQNPHTLRKQALWKSFLVIRLDAIGDVVCTTALIRELKHNYPKAKLTVVVRKETEPLLKDCPYINNLILFDGKQGKGELIEDWKDFENIDEKVSAYAAEYFSDKYFDAVFLPTEILCGRSGVEELLLALYSKADCRIGHLVDCDNYRRWMYGMVKTLFSKVVYQIYPMHETMFQLDMLRDCGLTIVNDKTELWVNKGSKKKIEVLLKEDGTSADDILIAVGLVGSIQVRNWKAQNYNELFHVFDTKYEGKVKFIILGGEDALGWASELEKNERTIIDLTGGCRSLNQWRAYKNVTLMWDPIQGFCILRTHWINHLLQFMQSWKMVLIGMEIVLQDMAAEKREV